MRRSLSMRWQRFALFFAVMGPGIITGAVDNDAPGIATYSMAGARFGYRMLWILLLLMITLALIQEMTSRMGVVTGKGLGALIRERFGVRTAFYVLAAVAFANAGTTIAEFAGIAAAGEIFGVSRYLTVPLGAVFVWLLVLRGSYRTVERFFLAFSLLYVTYIVSGFLARPPWAEVLREMVTPQVSLEPSFLLTMIAIVGTTIAPWMQFYQQAAVADKGISLKHYPQERLDSYVGSFVTVFVCFFVMVACGALLYPRGIRVETAGEAALALAPLAGRYCSALFALGLLNSSVMGASILPLSTAYAVSEAFGWESAVARPFREARPFYYFYTGMIVLGALAVLVPGLNLMQVMLLSQAVNGMVLPVVLVLMLLIINDPRVMGRYTNPRITNILCWAQAILVTLATAALVVTTFMQPAA
jgi:Mn2+/Fe2+ NRAMP family transporter